MIGKTAAYVFLSFVLVAVGQPAGYAQSGSSDLATHLIEKSGVSGGICAVLGCGECDVALEVAGSGRFLVHALDPRASVIDAARQAADAAGLDIRRIVFEKDSLRHLPHVDKLVDLVIAAELTQHTLATLSGTEVLRVLRPGGKAILGCRINRDGSGAALSISQLRLWLEAANIKDAEVGKDRLGVWAVISKPPLEGVDDWSHWEHGPDNNPVSTDTVITAPYMTQWLAKPYYIAMPAITTVAAGRIFTAMGHIAHHRREEAWLNTVLARNGYNGTELWRRKLPDGYLVHRSAFIATDDTFYMIEPDGTGCLLLDPESGAEKARVRIPDVPGQWKWIALEDGILFALIGREKDPAETTVVRSEFPAWSWGELSRGYYLERVPWGFGTTVAAYGLEEQKLLWAHKEDAPVDSRAMAVGEKQVFFYSPDSRVGCLDKRSGALLWVNDDPQVRALIEEGGRGLGSTPGFRSTCFCLYMPEVLSFAAQTRQNVVALSTEDGHYLWHRHKTTNNPNMVYADGHLLVGIGLDGSTLVLDPLTGETIEDLGFKKRSCARLTATPDSFFCRGWPEGLTRYNRIEKKVLFNGAIRPSCNDGVIGANGLLYMGPWLCDCNLSLMGTITLCSAQDPTSKLGPAAGARLELAYESPSRVARLDASPRDWATYRGSNERSASSAVDISPQLDSVWRYQPGEPYQPTAPTAAGGLVFLCGDDGKVRAIDAATGTLEWCFAAAGPIMQPATLWNGRAYVGSGDGYVYALEAATGRLLWRFRVAPVERRIMLYGSLCSTWPVNSGVLVEDGVAYAAAGLIDYDGTYVCALDAVTGEVIWENSTSGHLDEELRKGVSAHGSLTIADGRLWMPGGNVISPATYDLKTGAYRGGSPGDGSPRANRGEEIGVFKDRYVVLGGRLRYSAAKNVVNPGSFVGIEVASRARTPRSVALCGGKTVPAWDADGFVFVNGRNTRPAYCSAEAVEKHLSMRRASRGPRPMWAAKAFDNRDVVSLALTPRTVLAVCELQVHRTLASRWTLCTLDRENGSRKWEQDLYAPALSGGLLVDRDGRVIVVLQDGGVACFGGVGALEARIAGFAETAKAGGDDRGKAIRALEAMLRTVRGSETRGLLMKRLEELDVKVGHAGKKAGCVSKWMLLGPVPWDDSDNPMDTVFVGEPAVDVAKGCTIGGTRLEWSEYITLDHDGMVDLAMTFGPHEWVAVYAYGEVDLPKAHDLLLKIGSNDGFKCWFNGKEVGRFDGGRQYAPDQDALDVKGVKGTNTILLKISQMGGGWAFSVRLTDPDNNPIDLTRSAQ